MNYGNELGRLSVLIFALLDLDFVSANPGDCWRSEQVLILFFHPLIRFVRIIRPNELVLTFRRYLHRFESVTCNKSTGALHLHGLIITTAK